MRIVVKESSHNIRLYFPSAWMLNRWTAAAICREAEKHGVKIRHSQMRTFLKALKHYRRTHPEWVLVEVNGAKGEYVKVKL